MAAFLGRLRQVQEDTIHEDSETSAAVADTLYSFCEPRDGSRVSSPRRSSVGSTTEAALTLSSFVKCLTLCDLKPYAQNLQASVWQRYQDVHRRVPVPVAAQGLIDALAQDVVHWRHTGGKANKPPPPTTDPEVASLAAHIRSRLAARAACVHNDEDEDAYFELSWQDKAAIFRLRADYRRVASGASTGSTEGKGDTRSKVSTLAKTVLGEPQESRDAAAMCECGGGARGVAHTLQACEKYSSLRVQTWPRPVSLHTKLYGGKDDLMRTAAFMRKVPLTFGTTPETPAAIISKAPRVPSTAATTSADATQTKPSVTIERKVATVVFHQDYSQNQQLHQQHQQSPFRSISNNSGKLYDEKIDLYESHRLFYAPIEKVPNDNKEAAENQGNIESDEEEQITSIGK